MSGSEENPEESPSTSQKKTDVVVKNADSAKEEKSDLIESKGEEGQEESKECKEKTEDVKESKVDAKTAEEVTKESKENTKATKEVEETKESNEETKESKEDENGNQESVHSLASQVESKESLKNGECSKTEQKGESNDAGGSKDDIIVLGSSQMQPLTDKEWFDKLSEEELSWYKENGPSSSYFEYKTIQCTGCSNQILNTGLDQVFRHPFLGVAICRSCKNYYENGEWRKDEEGYDIYCRWCGNGGDLLLCDFCTHSFCKRCIQRNLGRRKLYEISKADKWKCLLCHPALIYYQRSMYHAFIQFQLEKSLSKRKSLKKKEVAPTHNRDTFLDENIGEAFKTLSIYQKCLEDERRKWIKCKKKMDKDAAGAIARNLRKIYAITKQNMDLLDADLMQSFSGLFPDNSSSSLAASKSTEVLVVPKKRRREEPSSPAPSHPDEFIVNGSPVTAEYHGPDIDEEFDPSSLLQVEFRETLTPSISIKPANNRFTKSISNNDSDIEVLTLDSDDEPSPPQPKKRKPGPRSKTMYLD